jgi:hypothetical protein
VLDSEETALSNGDLSYKNIIATVNTHQHAFISDYSTLQKSTHVGL